MAHTPDDPKGAGDPRHYQAYGTHGLYRGRLSILPVAGYEHAPSYDALLKVVFDSHDGTEIELVYHSLRIKIAGRHLQGLAAAIRERTCTFIREYHPKYFSPPDADTPVITRIEAVMCGDIELFLAKDQTRH